MTSVEKRRSGRKSGGHRKHSDGGYSDTSSGGSFLDENDREVSNLTDRAFRSLCIGDEAVYNDSDLSLSSPCTQRDRQMAFSHGGQDRGGGDREREELKRAAHENFSLRMQQYGQDWIHGGMYSAEIHRDPQWEVYGERTQGRVSATFQHSFVETSQQEKSLREEQLSFLSNGATELNSQQRRSRSRVSSLIRAFNSDGHRDVTGMDDKLRDWNDETSWDKSALMSIQQELSEFSTSYQQNFHSGHFPSAGPFSSRDADFYSSEVAAVTHMSHNSASSFMRSSHSKHSMSAQVNCNSNFFIHSEFSPFKVWRNHNRFPFQQGEVSGFMHCSEFPKWYETPMYNELSLHDQPQGPYRGIRHPRSNMAPVLPPNPPRSTSTSTMLQKASAVEKRCESELAGHYPHRKRSQSLGANRLPAQRPSTASPTIEMSRRVRDTISSVKALQQKIKMMSEQNITAGVIENQQGVLCSHDNLIPFGNNPVAVAPNVNTSTTPFNISQLLTPLVHAHQEAVTSDFQQYGVSPLPVEHAPVRAESRGATPDIRMSSYKSRATSLLFNLKDNRKRVKSTYSPPKFKGLETLDKNKQPYIQEPRETVIDMPDFPEPDGQFLQLEESSRTNAALNQYHSPGLPLTMLHSQPTAAHTGHYPEYTFSDYQTAQMQGQMVHHSGFTGFIPENYTSNQLANGQNLNEDLASFVPYKQGVIDNVGNFAGDVYRLKASYAETSRLNVDNNQNKDYLTSKANIEQPFNETVGRVFTKVDRYEQLEDNKHDYNNVSSQDMWRQTNSQDIEKLSLRAATSPWKQEALMEKTRQENQPNINEELKKTALRENLGVGAPSHKKADLVNTNISNLLPQSSFSNNTVENPAYYGQQQPFAFKEENVLQQYSGHSEENEAKENYSTQNYNRYTDQEYIRQHALYSTKEKPVAMQETGQMKHMSYQKGHEMQSLQPLEAKPQFEYNTQKHSLSNPDNISGPIMAKQMKNRQFAEVKAEQVMPEHVKVQHAQAELATAQQWAQVEQPKADSAKLILAGQTGSEKVKTEQAKSELSKQESVKQANDEHIKKEIRKGGQTEKSREKQPECAREEQTKAEQIRAEKVMDEPRNITEEAAAENKRDEQGKQVKAEQAEAERSREEFIKIELANTEQTGQERLKQTKTEQAAGKRVNADQVKQEKVSTEQVEREQREAEPIRTEKVNAEQAEAERRKGEQTKTEQGKDRETKAEHMKTKEDEVEKVKIDHIKVEDIRQAKEDLIQAEEPTTSKGTAKDAKPEKRKAEQAKVERTKVEQAKAELPKTENMQERSAKLAAKLTASQLFKSEPDRVEQVKTELAKAKAELAKIKEKMRGEQKEKVKNTVTLKEDDIAKNNLPLSVKISKNEDHEKHDQAAEMHQQKEASAVISSSSQAFRGAEDYIRLREKYGFTNAVSTNKNKASTTGNASLNDADETQVLPLDKAETLNTDKSKDVCSPANGFTTAKTENKEEGGSFKSSEVTESQYVYSESSKEFKLSNLDVKANGDSVADKVKDDSVEKLKKCDPVKDADVSLQRDSDLTKPPPLERKPKSTEHHTGQGKDLHFTPPKALSHKERAQTKQEILTSKIKAHAEKEISAIKEGFATRDGFSSKNSVKQLGGSQSVNIRQRPPSQEGSKKHESSSNITPKHQTEPLGGQMEPVKSASPPSSTTIPAKSAAATTQLADHLQKQETRKPLKGNSNVPEPPRKTNQTESYNMSTTEDLNQKQNNQRGITSPVQNKEHTPKIDHGKQQVNYGETAGKHKEEFKDNPAINTENVNKNKETPSQAASSRPVTTEKAESKEAAQEDSEPSISLVLGQNTATVADESLQIMGIMVTVRERKPSVSIDEGNNTTETKTEKKFDNSEPDKCHPNSGLEVIQRNSSSKEVSTAKTKDLQETKDQTKVGIKNQPETVQENVSYETRQHNVTENVTEKRTNLQQEASSKSAKPQREMQPEPQAEKGVPFTVTVPAKNKVLPETQPHLHKQDTIAKENKGHAAKSPNEKPAKSTDEVKTKTTEKNPQKTEAAVTSENFTAKRLNTGINKHDAEPLTTHGIQPSVKKDMTSVINQSKSSSIDDKSAKLPEEKRLTDSAPPKTSNKVSPSSNLTENEIRRQNNETHIGESNQEDDNVHIDCIAIRVVPAVTEKDSVATVGKHHIPTCPSDAVLGNEHKQVTSSSFNQKANPLNSKDQSKDFTQASSEKTMQDSLDDKKRVQDVLSSVRKLSDSLKMSNKQKSTNTNTGTTQAENEKPEKLVKSQNLVDESNIQPMGDYFQVQGVSNNELHNNNVTVGDASKGRELSGLQQNTTAVSNKSSKEGKTEVFVFSVDPDKRKAVESSSVSIQDESVKKKKWEREDKLASKQTDGSMERWSNNAVTEAVQTNLIRKHHTDNQSRSSSVERQSSRNSHTTKESTPKENPEAKPKPKERSSTIPEISALADYARLKVIVSEDREGNTVQEFPPNKKEGFFPLIQTRHSRRPVFTADPQDLSVKEKSLPSKTEMSAKVNKEPKALVYPITEKEHQRTGMFKLGDKERQEKMLIDAKGNEGVLDNAAKDAHLKERIKSPVAQTEMEAAGIKRVGQDPGVHQPNNHLLQATALPSAVNRPRHTAEGLTYLDQNSYPHENTTTLSKDKTTEQDKNTGAKTEDGRSDKLKNERPATQHEETKAKPQVRIKQVEEERVSRSKEEKREEDMRIKHILEESRASLAEEERRAIQREEDRRAREREAIALKIKERRDKQREAERRAEEERKAKHKEGEKAAQKEEEMRAKQREEEMRIKETEARQAKLREEEEKKREDEERRRAKKEEEERAAQEEQRKRAAQKEQQMRAAREEQQRRAAQEEQQRRAAEEEQQRKAQEEQKRRAALEEQQRRAAQEEQQRRAAEEEQQRRIQEEQTRRAALEEQQRRAAQEEQQRRIQEEQQRRAAQEEQQRRIQEEQKRRAALEEQQRRAAQEEQQRRVAEEEQQRRAAQEEQQRRAAQEEQQRRVQKEQKRRAAQEEQQRRVAQEEQQRQASLVEEQRRAKLMTDEKIRKEEKNAFISEAERLKHIEAQKKAEQQIEAQRREQQKKEEWIRAQRSEEEKKAVEKDKIIKQREEKQVKEERARVLEESQEELKEVKRVAQEGMLAQTEDEIQAKKREEKENLGAHKEKVRAAQMENQNRATQMDTLQYYAITSTESERTSRERQILSPLPPQQRSNPSGLESADDSHIRPYRPHAPASPAPSLPRSNASSPALGAKPSMFRVKDNTIRGSSFTKSVKPRFHKNFGEDFWMGSPVGSEKGEEEQEIVRRSAGTPVYPDPGFNRLAAINESSTFQSSSSSLDYSAHIPHHRPYSRRSIAMDEDDSRSVISNMSEDVESYATSATDLADIRGLYDSERPESACSFSSDVSRSLGKPPAVPPKSEKALRRAKRLTSRRINKELSKPAADNPAGVEKEVSSIPSSSSFEVRSSSRHSVASPHFSAPVSLAHAPALGSSLPSSHTEHQSSHRSFHASPHATGPVSLPVSSPHATAAVSLPTVSPHATVPASQSITPKTVAHVPSSPTLHRAKHPAPVTQYQVESSYPQSYPLTQRKVLQDLGSGQYFVVDVPVPVKTKTFFDPETGKYVQLNVRESGQSISQPQTQQSCPQPQLQPQMQITPQQQPLPQTSPADKPFGFYQGYHGYPQGYQHAAVNSAHSQRSSAPATLHQEQHPVRDSHNYGYPASETGQNSEGNRYSPEKTPYMDTVNDKDKTYNRVYNTHGSYESFPECDTNSQLAGSSICENDNSAPSRCQPRDIITMSELEDFMDMSDW